MKRMGILFLLVAFCLFHSGCTGLPVPVGMLYTNAKVPGTATEAKGTKTGSATVGFIIGIVTGDASIDAAAKAGGITTIRTVDYEVFNILGIFGRVTTHVTGE